MNLRRSKLMTTAPIECVALTLLLIVTRSFAQSAPPPAEPGLYRIAGRTVSAADGHALQGATVRIVNTKTQQLVASTPSGEDGSFEFTKLKADKYSLDAVVGGYLVSPYDEHDNFSSAIVTGAGVDTESLILKITPAAIIRGRITDEVGDPVRDANVMLYRENREEGRSRITSFRNSQTNDLGEYELTPLPPGNYFMSAKAMPWYATHPQLVNSANSVKTAGSVDHNLDVAFPTTFYADAMDSDGATPIPVRAGDHIDIDLHLRPQPAVIVTVHSDARMQDVRVLQLQESVFGQPEDVYGQMQITDTGTSFVGVPPGRYTLKQSNQTTGNGKSMAINLTSDNANIDAMSGEEEGTIKMHLRAENGLGAASTTMVALRSRNGGIASTQAVNEKGDVEFAGVKPGDYSVSVYGEDNYHVSKLLSEDGKASNNLLSAAAGTTRSFTVKVAKPCCAIEGFVRTDGKPSPGAMVVLVPAGPEADIELFRRDQSDLDGSFVLPNVMPGKYTAVAIQDGWTLEWGKSEVLAQYLPKGVPVAVSASEQQTLHLATDLIAQPR
jgi:protocatechuate 3,4-dioxygenase beta subunit